MTELDQVISAVYKDAEQSHLVRKVYATLFRTELFLPICAKDSPVALQYPDEPYIPLIVWEGDNIFMSVFDTEERLCAWAGENSDQIPYERVLGSDVVRGIGPGVYLCLNLGTTFYKEFPPEEVARLKTALAAVDRMGTR